MNHAPIYKIYQILLAVPLSGLWVLDTTALLSFSNIENNGRVRIIPWTIFAAQTTLAQTSTQPIIPEPKSTNTVVTPVKPSNNPSQTRFDITGGDRSQDDANLFHSFSRFNLGKNQIVNFISNPNIKNILTRVTGGDASLINGLIQVTGGNSNLFIMNPAGIIFGANARLDVPASFVVTTGSGIGFDSGWFNSQGDNNYDILTGTPSAFSFPMNNYGAIINGGELTVEAGETVALLGGTIINTGKISAPGGEITISAVPGENLVRISQEGRLLSLEIATENGENSNNEVGESESLNPLSIPELLTGDSEVMETATGVKINDNNEVVLTGSNQVIPTDNGTTIVSGSLDIASAENSDIANRSSINILGDKVGLFDAKLNASGIYSSGDVRIGGDSQNLGRVPTATRTYIDEKTEIFATSLRGEGGNIIISSQAETRFLGKIEAISYIGEESVSVEQYSTANLVEISSQETLIFDGTVNLGSPEILGNLLFKAENINIIDGNIDTTANPLMGETATESQISKSSLENTSDHINLSFEALDNITINELSEPELNFTNTKGKILFAADIDQNGVGSFTIDSESTINTEGAGITISGTEINTGNINTNGGEINLSSSQDFVRTNNLSTTNSNPTLESSGGDINVNAEGEVITGDINSSGNSQGGNIRISAGSNIDTEKINAEGEKSGGNIEITSENTLYLRGISTSSDSRETGNITLSGNEINLLGGEDSVSSNGRLTLQSVSENQNITLGGFENTEEANGSSPLHLTTADLATFANGFASITIGSSENIGTINISTAENGDSNGVIFNDPITMQAETITGAGAITGLDDATITLNARSNITTGDISTPTDVSITSTEGNVETGDITANTSDNSIGNIEITSANGLIETGKLTATGTTAGGNIHLQAGDRLTTGRINSSATSGNAGDVKLDAKSGIEVVSIQAEGANIGGNVEISTDDSLRITGTFFSQDRNVASISTAGELTGGNIAIFTQKTPFIVGDATTNGSVGAITDGNLTISPDTVLPNRFNLQEVQNSQPQNDDSTETTTETDSPSQASEPEPESIESNNSHESEPQPESTESNNSNQSEPQPESTESNNSHEAENQNDLVILPELPEAPKNIEQEQQTLVPTDDNEQASSNTNQQVQIASQDPEPSLPILESAEPTNPVPENIETSISSEEQITSLVVENQNLEQLEQPDNSQIIVENLEQTILVEETNPSLTSQTVAIENPSQGKSTQKPTPTIIVEENITSTGSEISPKNNYNQISLTDNISQIELTRGREFASYLGQNITKRTATAANIRNTLSSVAQIGIRPVIIYVSAQPNYLELQLFLPNGKPVVKSIDKTRDEVIEVAKKFTNQIRTPSQLNSQDYLFNSQKLYQWLVAPIAEELVKHNINTIVFSMDSGLRTIPIAALHDGQQFLVEKYSLGLIPNFTLTDTRYVGLKDAQVLAMGASKFPANVNQSPLPAVPVELSTIVNNIWPGKSFLNERFTLENLKQQRSQQKFRIIHLATHGEFHPGSADNSYIQFWDTKLRLSQLRQLRLYSPQVELLVLSACTTAVGDEDAELGFAGLAVQAGVKSALASLWYVSDTGTLALMTEFYQHLSERPIKAEALRKAQLAMLRGEVHLQDGRILRNGDRDLPLPPELTTTSQRDLSHPYYWAAFTMIGSPW